MGNNWYYVQYVIFEMVPRKQNHKYVIVGLFILKVVINSLIMENKYQQIVLIINCIKLIPVIDSEVMVAEEVYCEKEQEVNVNNCQVCNDGYTISEIECLIVNAAKSLCKENCKLTISHFQLTEQSENQRASMENRQTNKQRKHLTTSYFLQLGCTAQ